MPFADLTDVRCRYEIMGNGDPLLMINGLGSHCEKWGKAADELARSFTLILTDNRGMGQSVARRTPQNLADLAADFAELLDHLQLDRAHVLGLSFGGIVAQRLAIDHPGRVDRLVLVSCANRFGPYLAEITKMLEHTLRRFSYETFQRTMELLGKSPEFFDAHSGQFGCDLPGGVDVDKHRAAIVRQLGCLGREGVAPADEYRVHSPTLVISGEQDLLIPQYYARRMSREIPDSEFVMIPSCGHDPFVEKPDVLIPRIVEFISRSRADAIYKNNHHVNRIHDVMPAMEVVT